MEAFNDIHTDGFAGAGFGSDFLGQGSMTMKSPASFLNGVMDSAISEEMHFLPTMPSLNLSHGHDDDDDDDSGSDTYSDRSGSASPRQLDQYVNHESMYLPEEHMVPHQLMPVTHQAALSVDSQQTMRSYEEELPKLQRPDALEVEHQSATTVSQTTTSARAGRPRRAPKLTTEQELAAGVEPRKRGRKPSNRKRKAGTSLTSRPSSPTSTTEADGKKGRKSKKSKTEKSSNVLENLMEEQALKRKRLARKAELARLSRRKKKMRLDELEQEVADLQKIMADNEAKARRELEEERARTRQIERQLAEAQAKLRGGSPVTSVAAGTGLVAASHTQSNLNLQAAVKTMLAGYKDSKTTDVELNNLVKEVVGTFQKRTMASQYHLDQVEESMTTCLPLQFLEWLMSQNERFYEDPSGLWNSLLSQELESTPEQIEAMLKLRTGDSHKPSSELRAVFGKFNELLRQHLDLTLTTVTQMSKIFTPKQSIKFFEWVNRFGGVCVKINL